MYEEVVDMDLMSYLIDLLLNILPNELSYDHRVGGVIWGILIVLYPFFTGLIAGSFVVSSLAYGFGNKKYYKIAGLALLLSGALMTAPLFPMVELKQPERATLIFTNPHIFPSETYPGVSPMAVFGVVYLAYLIVLAIEIIFTFRADMAKRYEEKGGILNRIFSLGMGYDETVVKRDRAIVKTLALIGIPLAATFHAYVGFLFSSIKARPLWIDPIIPAHFLASAVFSGSALLVIAYYIFTKLSSEKALDVDLLKGLGGIMMWSLLIAMGLELISEASRTYYSLPGEGMLFYEELISEMGIRTPYYALSILILVLLLIPQLRSNVKVLMLTSLLALVQVFMYRWMSVLTPQLLSRTAMGLLEYNIEFLELRLSIGVVALTFLVFIILVWIFPWNGRFATHRDELEVV